MNTELLALYGPPGTGKTWRAAREAVRIVEPATYERWLASEISDDQMAARHSELVTAEQIFWVTFHPSYSYEDFVEGFRPNVSSSGQIIYEINDGPFILACTRAMGISGPIVGDTLTAVGGRKTYAVREVSPAGWLLEVRPDRSDQVGEEQRKFVDRGLIERAMEHDLPPKVFSIPGKGQKRYVDYGIDKAGTATGSEMRREVAEILGISSSDLSNSSHIGALYQELQDSAESKKDTPVVLVIDEINRADLSRVFGELITLIEADKRAGSPEERNVYLPYSKRSFSVPQGLSIIATMNTADRSLSAMDFALRRRFHFQELQPNVDLCPEEYGGLSIRKMLKSVNERISVLRTRDQRIGHSYFMEGKLEMLRRKLGFADGADGKIRTIAYVFRNQIVPLLSEYFHEDWREIELALGTFGKAFGQANASFLQEVRIPDSYLPDEFAAVTQLSSFDLPDWWLPTDDAFDASAFADAVNAMS